MSYFNEDQIDYMRYLASLPRAAKCDCGWAIRGECRSVTCYGHPEKGGVPDRLSPLSDYGSPDKKGAGQALLAVMEGGKQGG